MRVLDIQEKKREWIQKLCKEHRQISFQYGLRLKCPLVKIVDFQSFWGRWDGLTRTIEVSVRLIEEHSWDVVINVFKHEMAHQYVCDRLKREDGHGDFFQEACEKIGLEKQYRTSRGDLPQKVVHWKESSEEGKSQKMQRKVEKLLALAESKNEHESFLAMQKVRELYQKYNVERISHLTEFDYVYQVITHKKKRIESHQSLIGSILSSHFFVTVIFSDTYDAKACETFKSIELLGTRENVLMAEYVYFFLLNQLDILWKEYKKSTGVSGHTKRSYYLGVLSGFQKKLELQDSALESKVSAQSPLKAQNELMVLSDRKLVRFVRTRFPKIANRAYGGGRVDSTSYQQGKDQGRRLSLSKGVRDRSGYRGLLLTRGLS